MPDDFDDAPETRDTPSASSSAPEVLDHDEEPEERRDTPPRGAAPTATGDADPSQVAAEEALAALEANPLYQQLPAGYKRKVLAGQASVEEAVAQRQRQLIAAGQGNARKIVQEQERAAAAIQQLEASHKQSLLDMEIRVANRFEKLLRQLTGEPEPEEKPAGPLDPRDQLLLGVAQKLDAMGSVQAKQAEEQQIAQEMRAVEEYSAADVERHIAAVPWYPEAEAFVEQQAFIAELSMINDTWPELSDQQAEQLAARRVMEMAANLMTEAKSKRVSLAAEIIRKAQELGFQPRGAAPEQPAPRPGSPKARLADQLRREQAVAGPTTGARGRPSTDLTVMSRDIAAKATAMSDEDWADFIGEGKEGDRRARQIISQRAE